MKHYTDAKKTSEMMEVFSASARPTLTIDVAKYQEYLDGSELTPEQKEEFLKAAWSIVLSFVELGYGVHPLQEACGKERETDLLGPAESPDAVGCEDQNSTKPLEKPAPPGKPEVK